MATELEEQLYEEHAKLSANAEGDDDLGEEIAALEADIDKGEETPEVGEIDQPKKAEGEEKAGKEEKADSDDNAPLIPPHTWPEQYKKDFAELPRAAQKRMLEIDRNLVNGFQKKTGEMGRMMRELGPIRQAVQNHEDRLRRAGIDPATAIHRSLAWDAHIAQHGVQGFMDMAKAYGFDLGQFQQSSNQEYLTPTERQLREQVETLSQAFQRQQSEMTQRQQQWVQAQRQAQGQQAVQQLEGFMQEKSPDGKLRHPYVEHVSDAMARLINSQVVDNLEDAYQIAVQRHPQISAALEQQRQAERVSEQQRIADKARNATQGVIAKSPDIPGGGGDFESQLKAAYRKIA